MGTLGRVYGGDPDLIHVVDGERAAMGRLMAQYVDLTMRVKAKGRTDMEALMQKLCPGCYMVVGFNMLVSLAEQNGQDVKELARCMQLAFKKLEEKGTYLTTEEIDVILDPDECEDGSCPPDRDTFGAVT